MEEAGREPAIAMKDTACVLAEESLRSITSGRKLDGAEKGG